MNNATRRVNRAGKRASAELDGLGTLDKPLVLSRKNIKLFIAATAASFYSNPRTTKYRRSQKKRGTP